MNIRQHKPNRKPPGLYIRRKALQYIFFAGMIKVYILRKVIGNAVGAKEAGAEIELLLLKVSAQGPVYKVPVRGIWLITGLVFELALVGITHIRSYRAITCYGRPYVVANANGYVQDGLARIVQAHELAG